MSLSPKTDPVLLANVVPGALTALAAVLTAFDWWDPTEEQLGALAGLLAALIAFATAYARGKVDSPATTQAKEVAAAFVVGQRDEARDIADQAVAEVAHVKAEAAAAVPQPSIGKVTAEALAAIEAMRQGMVNLAPEVAQQVVTHLNQQVQATPRPKAEVSVPVPPTVAIHPVVGPVGGRSGPGSEGNV